MGVKTAMEWLHSCSGCEIAILNIGEALVPIITEALEIVHAPVLMDHKYFGQTGEGVTLTIPEATVGIVTGGVANHEHMEVLEEMRKKCTILIALGTCATHGGIPALMNGQDREESWGEIFSRADEGGESVPNIGVPAPLDRVYACDEKVKIDMQLPGCPPNPELIAEVILSLVEGRPAVLPGRSVCDTCPTKREGKGSVDKLKRFITNAEFTPGEPIDEMRCLLEQGYLCMGPVTAAGCAKRGGAPSCISARVPCRGCFGPVRGDGNQMLDMMNALASNGISCDSIEDRRSMLRFSGAHGRLRPLKKPVVKED